MSTLTDSANNVPLTSDRYLSELDDDLTSVTDISLLKFQLKRQRKKVFAIIDELIKRELAYESTVARVDHENLSRAHQGLSDEHQRLKEEYQHLGHACLYLINKTHDLIDERNKYYHEWQTNRALLTPRPDWDKVANVIDGGLERWKSLATGKSSDYLVDVLVKEIIHGNELEAVGEKDYFESNGDHSSVMPFLQTPKHTRIFNRRLRRRMTGLLIKEIWTDKIKKPRDLIPSESSSRRLPSLIKTDDLPSETDLHQPLQTLADHVAAYFEKRFDSKATAVEMGYNLRDACLRYHNSEEINLFWGIVTGQIEEMVYHHRMRSVSQLLQHLMRMRTFFASQQEPALPQARKAIVSEPNSPLSVIAHRRLSALSLFSTKGHRESLAPHDALIMTEEQFIESLKLLYPHKTIAEIDTLVLSAKHDLSYSTQTIEFSLLFIEDTGGRFGQFLSTLVKQINQERISYVEQIRQILLGYSLITVSQFTRAVSMVDPKIPQNELHRYIEWVFSLKNYSSSQQAIKPLDSEDLLRRLENCACFKH